MVLIIKGGMHQHPFFELLSKYFEGNLSPQEDFLLEEYYKRLSENARATLTMEEEDALGKEMWENIQSEIKIKREIPHKKDKKIILWMAAASVALILIVVGMGWWEFSEKGTDEMAKQDIEQVHPGGNKAILTLADGSKLALGDSIQKQLSQKTSVYVDSGLLAYKSRKNPDQKENIKYNKLATPRGGQFRLQLSDGTKVWLNAASSIIYPTHFSGDSRKVQVTGEAYFEVARDKAHPFIVESGEMKVQVLGTHFDVKNYEEEEVNQVSLISGIVQVTANKKSLELQPGEQVKSLINEGLKKTKIEDIDGTVAWTKGQMYLSGVDFKEMMNKISRWYDVDVKYEGAIPNIQLNGMISRRVKLENILNVLQSYQVSCSFENGTIIIF